MCSSFALLSFHSYLNLCVFVFVYMSNVDSNELRKREKESQQKQKRIKTLTNPANYRVIKYIREAYLVRGKSRWKSFHMHCNRFLRIELNSGITSAITNFRIMCTTFIIIDLRGFFHFVWGIFLCLVKRRKKTIERHKRAWKNDTWRIFSPLLLLCAVCKNGFAARN